MDMDFGGNLGSPEGLQGSVRRIPTLASSQYGTIDTPITFTADFEVEVEFATTDTGLQQLVDGSVATLCRISMNAGVFTMFVGNGASWIVLVAGTNTFNDGKIHKVRLNKSGNDYALYVDDLLEASVTTATSVTPEIAKIGAQFDNVNLFNGEILSTKFTDQSGAEDVVTNFVFDSGSTTDQPSRGGGNNVSLTNFATTDWNRYTQQRNILHDAGVIAEGWLGDSLVVNGGFDADSDWAKGAGWTISGGTANIAVGAQSNISQSVYVVGLKYMVKVTLLDYTAGELVIFIGSGRNFPGFVANEAVTVVGQCIGSTTMFLQSLINSDFSLDNVSAQRLLEVA